MGSGVQASFGLNGEDVWNSSTLRSPNAWQLAPTLLSRKWDQFICLFYHQMRPLEESEAYMTHKINVLAHGKI